MKNKISAVCFNRYSFIITIVVACVGWVVFLVGNIFRGNFFDESIGAGPVSLAYLPLILLLLISYRRGETNVQKTILGALLALIVFDYADWVNFCFYSEVGAVFVYSVVFGVSMVVLFVLHMFQQMDHVGKSKCIRISQFCGVLLILLLAANIALAILGQIRFENLVWNLSITATVFLILMIEARIAEYKKIRASKMAEGCWTEEERQKAKKIFAL